MTATRTGPHDHDSDGITCIEVVRLVTDYLEGAMSEAERVRFESHLGGCEGCDAYIAQMRTTIRVTGRLTPEDIDPEAREQLLQAFRTWKTQQPSRSGLLHKLRQRFKR